jgi:hypothetical protein
MRGILTVASKSHDNIPRGRIAVAAISIGGSLGVVLSGRSVQQGLDLLKPPERPHGVETKNVRPLLTSTLCQEPILALPNRRLQE